jgi:hypothetical protein
MIDALSEPSSLLCHAVHDLEIVEAAVTDGAPVGRAEDPPNVVHVHVTVITHRAPGHRQLGTCRPVSKRVSVSEATIQLTD